MRRRRGHRSRVRVRSAKLNKEYYIPEYDCLARQFIKSLQRSSILDISREYYTVPNSRKDIRLLSSRHVFHIPRRAVTNAPCYTCIDAYHRTCNVIYLAINLSALIYYAKHVSPIVSRRRDASRGRIMRDSYPESRTSKTHDNKFS